MFQGKIIPRVTEVIEQGGESRRPGFRRIVLAHCVPWGTASSTTSSYGVHPGRPETRLIRVRVEEEKDGIYVTV